MPDALEEKNNNGFCIERIDAQGRTELLRAIDENDFAKAKILAARGANLLHVDHSGRGAAHYCNHDRTMLAWIAEAGVALDRPDYAGTTPLMHAVQLDDDESTRFLAARPEVDVNRRMENQKTILLTILNRDWNWGEGTRAAIRALLANGADMVHERQAILAWAAMEACAFSSEDRRLGTEILEWENHVYALHLMPHRVFRESDFLDEGGRLTPKAKQLAATGLLPEAFAPERWRGHEREAVRAMGALLPLLPDFQRERYALPLDPTPFINASTPHTEKITARRPDGFTPPTR